jgi:hypothetical protein
MPTCRCAPDSPAGVGRSPPYLPRGPASLRSLSHGRPMLLLPAVDAAPTGSRHSLGAACAAPIGSRHCSLGRPALLAPAALDAPIHHRCCCRWGCCKPGRWCYRGPPTLLSWAVDAAPMGGPRCYHRPPVVLPAGMLQNGGDDNAIGGEWWCYRGPPTLLLWAPHVFGSGYWRRCCQRLEAVLPAA